MLVFITEWHPTGVKVEFSSCWLLNKRHNGLWMLQKMVFFLLNYLSHLHIFCHNSIYFLVYLVSSLKIFIKLYMSKVPVLLYSFDIGLLIFTWNSKDEFMVLWWAWVSLPHICDRTNSQIENYYYDITAISHPLSFLFGGGGVLLILSILL